MYWMNNLLTLMANTTESASEAQILWLVLGGLFLVVLIAVVIAVASTSAASAAVAVDDEDSADL